jgi:hypothetical protein
MRPIGIASLEDKDCPENGCLGIAVHLRKRFSPIQIWLPKKAHFDQKSVRVIGKNVLDGFH